MFAPRRRPLKLTLVAGDVRDDLRALASGSHDCPCLAWHSRPPPEELALVPQAGPASGPQEPGLRIAGKCIAGIYPAPSLLDLGWQRFS